LPVVLARAGATVVCVPASLAMARPALGRCQRAGQGGWSFEGDFLEPPLPCGGSIIVSSVATSIAHEIVARSFDSGKVQARVLSWLAPAIACADPDALLVGDRQLRLLRLPSLTTAWRQAVRGGSVRDVAIGKRFVAYRLDESLDVVVVPRPASHP
jgi:hypothetical protein